MAVAVLKQRKSNPTSFTVADGTAIPKGTLCKITTPRTAIANDVSGSAIAGVCSRDKVADDGLTEVGMFTDGIFDMLVSGSVTLNAGVVAGKDVNSVTGAGAAFPIASGSSVIIGRALETGADNATVQIQLNIA